MLRRLIIVIMLASPIQGNAQNWKKLLKTTVEHVALGAGIEVGVSQVAGGPNKYAAGIVAAGLVAGFKEGSDAVAGRDTKGKAALHAITILAGAGLMAGVRH